MHVLKYCSNAWYVSEKKPPLKSSKSLVNASTPTPYRSHIDRLDVFNYEEISMWCCCGRVVSPGIRGKKAFNGAGSRWEPRAEAKWVHNNRYEQEEMWNSAGQDTDQQKPWWKKKVDERREEVYLEFNGLSLSLSPLFTRFFFCFLMIVVAQSVGIRSLDIPVLTNSFWVRFSCIIHWKTILLFLLLLFMSWTFSIFFSHILFINLSLSHKWKCL